jgi:hypothetical protein
MRRFGVLLLIMGLIVTISPIYTLAGSAVDFTNPTIDFTNGNWSLGWEFTVNQLIMVKSLGFYDDSKNGLTELHDVGIFNGAQVLIVSGQVQPGDPLISWWRWTNVTPTLLVPQELYQIAAVTGGENYTWNPVGFTVDPSVNFRMDSWFSPSGSGMLMYPNSTNNTTGYFGPNFSTEAVVPVPGAVLLVIPGLMTLIGLRRKLS